MAIALKFTGSDEGARATAEALAKSLDKLGISADSVKFDVATKGSTDLYGSLRNLKAEAVQHERVFGFFGRQLAETGLIARDTASALVGLGAGLASGMYLMAAVEAAKLLVGWLKDSGKEGEEALKKIEEATKKVQEAQQALADKAAGVTKTMREQATVLTALATQEAKTAAIKAEQATTWGIIKVIAKELVGIGDKQIENAERLLAATRQQAFELAALASREAGVAKSDAAAEAAKEAHKKEAADWKAFQDSLVAEGVAAAIKEAQAEAKIREDARKKEEAEILAWQKEMERIEGPEAQRKGERALQDYEQKRDAEALAEKVRATHELAMAGSLAADAFASIGQAIGGVAGNMVAVFGKLIQQAIQLAIAMSAQLPPPLGILNMAASAAAILATIASVPKFEAGTAWVPRTGLALVHQGERIIPADENRHGGAGRGAIHLNFYGPTDREYFRQNRGNILRAVSEAARDGRKG